MYNLYTLKNGLRIVTEYIEHVNSISVGLFVENGSRNETEVENGISHFIEHMLFKGTKNRSAKKLVEEIENVGGQLNAYTSKESTCYYVKSLDTHIDLCLDIISDMLFNSVFNEEEIEKEKRVVNEEINMSEDTPEEVLTDLHAKAVFGEDSLAYPILGYEENINSFSRKDIIDYLSRYYTPTNSVISICGKFNQKDIEALVDKYFGVWENKNNVHIKYSIPRQEKFYLGEDKKIEQLHVNLGLKGTALGDDRGYSLILLNNILGGGASSILFQKLREDLGACYSVYSYLLAYKNIGVLNIYAGLGPSYAKVALEETRDILSKFSINDINHESLLINKEKIKASYILGLESTSSRMFSNGKSMLFLNKISTPDKIIEKIDNIDLESIEEVYLDCIKPGVMNGAFVGHNVNVEELKNLIK
ncbi:Predicted Zn-dependent peptidase [Clostridium cavendishii DSM 21758]|uniref:Predicted Zn-dependent peptidase n=1 Tax=Clostridium cavendishii DSM 21758 TaxID=1121302 RepID=A0A1M6RNB1_9CLOT|nr:pitrilysin family protein [Clostridium cavendishii]SHK33942.1 Predicted Zn-dependent peptidase [Clostridium cavendishii DSM 21758]